jgi:hypothetical protein
VKSLGQELPDCPNTACDQRADWIVVHQLVSSDMGGMMPRGAIGTCGQAATTWTVFAARTHKFLLNIGREIGMD